MKSILTFIDILGSRAGHLDIYNYGMLLQNFAKEYTCSIYPLPLIENEEQKALTTDLKEQNNVHSIYKLSLH